MTNSVQKNSSTVICSVNAEMSELRRVSQENERLFRGLVASLNNLSEKLIKLDLQLKKKIIEDGLDYDDDE